MDYPFTTDGCSGGMTACWRAIFRRPPPWNDLCVEHDRAYWAGGTAEQRSDADRFLMVGVTINGHPIFAFLMWCAVRVGGHWLLPLPWRWGYGYRWPRPYTVKPPADVAGGGASSGRSPPGGASPPSA